MAVSASIVKESVFPPDSAMRKGAADLFRPADAWEYDPTEGVYGPAIWGKSFLNRQGCPGWTWCANVLAPIYYLGAFLWGVS